MYCSGQPVAPSILFPGPRLISPVCTDLYRKSDCFAKHQPGVAGCGWLKPGRNVLSLNLAPFLLFNPVGKMYPISIGGGLFSKVIINYVLKSILMITNFQIDTKKHFLSLCHSTTLLSLCLALFLRVMLCPLFTVWLAAFFSL